MVRQSARSRGYQAALAVVALLAGACGTGSEPPLAPTPVAPGPPAAAPAPEPESWFLDETLVSVTGAEICGWDGARVGKTVTWPLNVRRTGAAVRFVYGDVMDEVDLVGILEGEAFTASASVPSYQPCLGERRDYILESSVAGRFSADLSALTARATYTYRFASGEAIVFTFDWVATRR